MRIKLPPKAEVGARQRLAKAAPENPGYRPQSAALVGDNKFPPIHTGKVLTKSKLGELRPQSSLRILLFCSWSPVLSADAMLGSHTGESYWSQRDQS